MVEQCSGRVSLVWSRQNGLLGNVFSFLITFSILSWSFVFCGKVEVVRPIDSAAVFSLTSKLVFLKQELRVGRIIQAWVHSFQPLRQWITKHMAIHYGMKADSSASVNHQAYVDIATIIVSMRCLNCSLISVGVITYFDSCATTVNWCSIKTLNSVGKEPFGKHYSPLRYISLEIIFLLP